MHRPPRSGCGLPGGYRIHVVLDEEPCLPCTDAHYRDIGAVTRPIQPLLYILARAGREPIEVLLPADRDRLFSELHGAGLTDSEIAHLTRATVYTTSRIRARLGLLPNQQAVPSTRGAA